MTLLSIPSLLLVDPLVFNQALPVSALYTPPRDTCIEKLDSTHMLLSISFTYHSPWQGCIVTLWQWLLLALILGEYHLQWWCGVWLSPLLCETATYKKVPHKFSAEVGKNTPSHQITSLLPSQVTMLLGLQAPNTWAPFFRLSGSLLVSLNLARFSSAVVTDATSSLT